jgi:transcription-repair coupling factor (superfamily II helicase)
VLPHAADVEAFADDLAIFTNADVAVLPAVETIDDDELAGSPDAAARLAVVKRLTQASPADRPQIVVTSIQALLSPLDDPREISASTRLLEVGGRLDPSERRERGERLRNHARARLGLDRMLDDLDTFFRDTLSTPR